MNLVIYAVKQSSLRGAVIAVFHYIAQVDILGRYSLSCLILSDGVFRNCLKSSSNDKSIHPTVILPQVHPHVHPYTPSPHGVCLQQQMEERIAAVSSEKDQCLAEKDRQSEEKFTAKVHNHL